jgi:hypothetical protein
MKASACCCFLFLMAAFEGFSQDFHQTVKGRVIDRDSRETLVGANVIILGADPLLGGTTDFNGEFRIEKVPVGRHSIKVSFVGFTEVILPDVLVSTGKETDLTIGLVENVKQLAEVRVTASQSDRDKSLNTMAAVSARKLNMEDALRYAGGFNDPSRMVSSFAGVAAVEGDGVNDIVIRGNSPRGLLWRCEGIEIPNPNHFTDGQGASGGAIGIITSNILASSDFLTGAFPAEYGNAFSGVMDLNLRKGNQDKREYAFQFSVAGTELALEGPFSSRHKSSYLVNYRYSTFALLDQMGLVDLGNNNLPPVFQDLGLVLNFPTPKAGTLTLFSVAGKSTTGTKPVKDSLQWNGDDGRYYETEDHQMGAVGLKHVYVFPGKKTYLKSVIAATYQGDQWDEGNLDATYEKFNEYKDDFTYPAFRSSFLVNSKLSARHVIRGGIQYSQLFYHGFAREYRDVTATYDTLIDQDGNAGLLQAHLQWKYRLSDRVELNTGMHTMFFALNNNFAAEPRFGLKWNLSPLSSLNLGMGMHSRVESIPVYMALVPQPYGPAEPVNKGLGFVRAVHFVTGYDHAFNEDWRMKIEAYYQYLFHIPAEDAEGSKISALNFGYGIPDRKLVNDGTGYNYGLEFTLEKFYTRGYYLLYTASAYDSKFLAGDDKWYNTLYNGNYVTNLLAGKDYKFGRSRQNTFGINAKSILRGGFRYTPLDREQSIAQGHEVYLESEFLEKRLPDYFRIDLGAKILINKTRYSYMVSIDIQNVINRKTILGYEYEGPLFTTDPFYGQGLIPILNFRIEF